MADAVAGINILGVCLVLYVVLPQRGAVCLGISTGQAEHRPHIAAAARRYARQPVEARPPRQTEQHRFRLIGHCVRGGDDSLLPGGQLIKPAIAQPARPILTGVGRDFDPFLRSIIQEQLNAVLAAKIRHKISITRGRRAPYAVVDMGGLHLDFKCAAVAQQKKQQSH